MRGGPPPGPTPARLGAGPGCPRCGHRRIWTGRLNVAAACPGCELDLQRHGWLAAMWIEMWLTIVLVIGWIAGGMVVTGGAGPWWVTSGGIAIAVATPPLTYRYAKAAMLRLLFRLDPPSTMGVRR